MADGKPWWSRTFASAVQSLTVAPGRGTVVVRLAGGARKELDLATGRNVRSVVMTETKAIGPATTK